MKRLIIAALAALAAPLALGQVCPDRSGLTTGSGKDLVDLAPGTITEQDWNRAQTSEPFAAKLGIGFLDAREHVVKRVDAAAVLGRAGPLAGEADRVDHALGEGGGLLDADVDLPALAGRVVAVYAFQMLCPGCVANALPQAQRLREAFAESDLAVIGLHTVFEHHAAMTEAALEAFIHEYRLTLPVGVDRPGEDGPIPRTMRRYGMRGTPSTIVIDRDGVVREHAFGQVDDLALGVLVGSLVAASAVSTARTLKPYAPGPESARPDRVTGLVHGCHDGDGAAEAARVWVSVKRTCRRAATSSHRGMTRPKSRGRFSRRSCSNRLAHPMNSRCWTW